MKIVGLFLLLYLYPLFINVSAGGVDGVVAPPQKKKLEAFLPISFIPLTKPYARHCVFFYILVINS